MMRVPLRRAEEQNGANRHARGRNGRHNNNGNGALTIEKVLRGHARCTDELTERMCEHLRNMLPPRDACALEFLPESYHWSWMKKGRLYLEDVEQGRTPQEGDERFARYYLKVMRALAEFRKRLISRSLEPDAFMMTWVRDITILERRDRDNWGRSNEPVIRQEEFDPDESFL